MKLNEEDLKRFINKYFNYRDNCIYKLIFTLNVKKQLLILEGNVSQWRNQKVILEDACRHLHEISNLFSLELALGGN